MMLCTVVLMTPVWVTYDNYNVAIIVSSLGTHPVAAATATQRNEKTGCDDS